ncbi:MAG: phage tail tape measure protein, partial [Synergistaceae bacterium]|nr:phage tail tape measure protein [Synergistaceae bacterium]
MAKAMEITFAIGAALAGSFSGAFGKAGKALSDFQKQAEQIQKQSGQIESYQGLQGAIVKNSAEMYKAREEAQALNAQSEISKTRTQDLSSQYRTAQQATENLRAENVRNTDAYKAAQLNMKSLANQIEASSKPTGELQRQYKAAQEEVRRLEGAMKSSSAAVKAAQKNEQELGRQLKESQKETKSLSDKSKELTTSADDLQKKIERDTESLSRMGKELRAAGVDTANLAGEQSRLTRQSQRMAEAQARYQRSKAALDQTRQNLSWNNIRGELMTAAGLGYTLYKPVSQAADFESAMARVNAVAFSGAGRNAEEDAKSLQALTEQARQLGRDTQFTAVQAAQSQENLARAGFKANEIISAMPGLLNMAAAEGMDLAQASDIAASTLRGFKLSADQMNRVADVLAQTSAASNTNIVGLGEGMKYVAPVAANLGVSLEETSAMLGIMANAGIKGTEGGTALRGAFLRLAQEPKAVEKALNALGVASRDARGNMRKLPDIMTELSEKMKDMGDADRMKYLANIFGIRAVSGMMAVMNGVMDGSLEVLTQYNKEATGIPKAIAEATGISIEAMRTAMKGAEPFAEKLGISYRDLSIYAGMLAKRGLKGATANNLLSATFKQLTQNSKQVQKGLKGYGIALTGANGKIRDFPDILNDLNKAMKDMDDAKKLNVLEKIFGDQNAAVAVNALMKELSAGSFTELNKKADNAKGTSYEMMQKQLSTFKGQWDIAKSAMSDFMIETGNRLLPYVTKIVTGLGKVTSGIVKVMKKYPEMTDIVVKGLGAIAALKVADTIGKIGKALLTLPGAWIESVRAARELQRVTETVGSAATVAGGKFSGLWGIVAAHPFMALLTVTLLIVANWERICELVKKVIGWCGEVGKTLSSPEFKQATSAVSMGGTQQKPGTAEYHVQAMNSMYAPPSIARAKGGIITRPEVALIGEAGREAIIPLERQSRGTELWLEAGRELGLISNSTAIMNAGDFTAGTQNYNVIPEIVNALKLQPETLTMNSETANSYSELNRIQNMTQSYTTVSEMMPEIINAMSIQPHATGGIFSQPHLGLVAEAGREAVIPLEDKSRGLPLWMAA